MYEPVRHLNSCLVEGGVTHAVNTDHIEDIYFFGDMACIRLVSGEQFNVTRHEACLLLGSFNKYGEKVSEERVSKDIASMEDMGRSYEKSKNDAANLKGGGAG